MENKLKKLEQLFEMQEGTLRPDNPLVFCCDDGR